MSQVSLEQVLRSTLGLRHFFDGFEGFEGKTAPSSFPPYNIIVDDHDNPKTFTIELAVAGFTRDQLKIQLTKESGLPVLEIIGDQQGTEDTRKFSYRGMRSNKFVRKFIASANVRPGKVTLVDGILSITLVEIEPQNDNILLSIA